MGFEPGFEFLVEFLAALLIGLALLGEDDVVVLVMSHLTAEAGFFVTEAGGEVAVRHAEIDCGLFDGVEGYPALFGFDVYGYGVCCGDVHFELGVRRFEVGGMRYEV